ncbi:MAG: MFS transporter [Actinobacteria bacterium]|nr:MFS transporter [Actinomycetota bacterium]
MERDNAAARPPTSGRPLASNRPLVLLLLSQSLGMVARGIYFVSLPLFVLERTGSAFSMSLSLFLGFAPFTLAGPFAGAVVDRFSRRDLIVLSNLLYGAALFALPFMHAQYLIFANAFIASLFGVILVNAISALIPELVDTPHLAKANSLYTFLRSVTYLLSMFITYFLIGRLGKANVFFICSLLLLPSGLICLALRRDRPSARAWREKAAAGPVAESPAAEGPATGGTPVGIEMPLGAPAAESESLAVAERRGAYAGNRGQGRRGFRDALHVLCSDRHVRGLTLMHLTFMPIFGAFEVLLPVFCDEKLKNADYYALVSAGVGAGLALGSLLTYRLLARFRPLGLVFGSFVGYAVGVFVFSRIGRLAPALAASAFMGLVDAFGFTTYEYLRQRVVPSALRGRVFAIMDAVVLLPLPAGYLLMGFFAERTPVADLGLWLSAAGLCLALLTFPLTRGLPTLTDRMEGAEP